MWRLGAIAGLLAAACSGGPSLAFSELDHAMLQARCERAARCKLFSDEASCLAFTRPDPNPSIAGAMGANKLSYDGRRAKQCVDATSKQSCDVTAHDAHIAPAACAEMFTGLVADGAACSIDEECKSGTCTLPNNCPERQCCTGACRATQAAGKAGDGCAKPRDCGAGLVCGADQTCHTAGKANAACGSDRECADGLACIDLIAGKPGICHALPHAGEPCPNHRCAEDNLRCDDDTTHTCVPVGLPGAPCPTLTECAAGAECDATTHLCRERPSLGMPCKGACTGPSFCVLDGPMAHTCVALLVNGQPCDGNQQCVSSFCEDGAVFRSCIDPYVCF